MLNDIAARRANALELEGANRNGTLGRSIDVYGNLRSPQLHTLSFESSSATFVAIDPLLSSMKSRIFSRAPSFIKAR